MMRFPLQVPILLITTGGKYIGRITHAGDDFIRMIDVVERIITPSGDHLYADEELSGVIHFSRNNVVGFKPLDQSELYLNEQEYTKNIIDAYDESITSVKRSKFKLLTTIKKSPKNQKEVNHE